MPTPAPHLVDEILEEIFLRLPTPAELARASTACPRFRRIITDRSFLCRHRKRHPPPLLGLVNVDGSFQPAEAPHPSAPLARALADAADFTYSFVPVPSNGIPWHVRDVRDGRVLLEACQVLETLKDMAVCDPLSRRYVLLPPIPTDVAVQEEYPFDIVPILAPIGDDEDDMSFKVIFLAIYGSKLTAFVFSSVTQQWCMAASIGWSLLGVPHRPLGPCMLSTYGFCGLSGFDNEGGCFYLASPLLDKLFVLDTQKMEFFTVNHHTGYYILLKLLPGRILKVLARYDDPHRIQDRSMPGIVVGREGYLEMFSLIGDHSPNGSFDLYHTTQQSNDESSNEWRMKNITPLPGGHDYFTMSAAEGFLFLGATTKDQVDFDRESGPPLSRTDWDVHYFSLEVKTSEVRKVCTSKGKFFHAEHVHWYFGYPPSLSKPSV
ncbi:hypothetical protein CFC21_091630 [Triticum aestivum]|uniref:F-box domain-containing protein n=2 Tax=Triticum aestivum TaxID=4565 RepID=A0A3B6QAW5_WHEAT|nr:uncharacterized protein LOC123141141 [Triticum aestivum]KAF7088528.1 hypothetical protein CFC21_091630 [Triticum aestivum]